ncbi:MFS transporter [Pseudonocardia sp. CA-107938]|uniref:MFS transporter n=1 Tax=Pseudonocardia sp. CA-107938 TaxID=3240021 RepID=UPI003D93DA70
MSTTSAPPAYRTVVRTPGMGGWTLGVLCQRLPIAMAPLALVYVGHVAGSYAVGALLAAVFAAAEAVAAGPMGRRFDRRPARSEIRLVLCVQAVLLLALAGSTLAATPVWLLVLLSAAAGAVASGAHGGLRAVLVRTVEPAAHHAALSLESTLTTLLWAVGPAIVGLVTLVAGAGWAVALIAAIAAAGVLAAGLLLDAAPVHRDPTVTVRIWGRTWPALLQEGAVMVCVGAAYTGLPSLLEAVGSDATTAGPVLAVFAVAGLVGGLAYGSRTWPGSYRTQSTVLVLAVAAVLALAVVMPTAGVIGTLVVLAGFAGTPALTARAAGVQELLPEPSWAAGFSGLYAAGGVGFGAAGIVLAGLLEPLGARAALLACVAVAAIAAVVGSVAERRVVRQ